MGYGFWVVAIGSMLLALAASVVGSFNVLKGQSLVGDALGHATFLGVVIGFMIVGNRNIIALTIGSMIAGFLALACIHFITAHSKVSADSAMAITLTSFFALGMVLKSYIQANPDFSENSQAGLQNYLFGQAAYMMNQDVELLFVVVIIVFSLIILFYKELKALIFDPSILHMSGISIRLVDFILMFMTLLVISVGLKLMGIVMIASLLTIPTIIGRCYSHNYIQVVTIGSIASMASAFLGTYISSQISISTGPLIILILGSIAIVSLFIDYLKRRRISS